MRQALLADGTLQPVTLVGQDWGGLVGLRLLAENPDRSARIVVANTGLPTGDQHTSKAFLAWQRYFQDTPKIRVSRIVVSGCTTSLEPEVVRAYDAPFPDESYEAGARVFPTLVPTRPDDPAAEANRRAWQVLSHWDKPLLTAFSDSDAVTAGGERSSTSSCPARRGSPTPSSPAADTSCRRTAASSSPRSS